MKTGILAASLAVLLALIAWQRQAISALHAEAQSVAARASTASAAPAEPGVAAAARTGGQEAGPRTLSDDEMQATYTALVMLADGRIANFRRLAIENDHGLIDTIEHLSAGQVGVLFERFRRESPEKLKRRLDRPRDHGEPIGLQDFLDEVNPSGMIEAYLHGDNLEDAAVRGAAVFRSWFRRDPQGLRQWAENWQRESGEITITDGKEVANGHNDFAHQAALWTAAAKILEDPASPAVAAFAQELQRDEALPKDNLTSSRIQRNENGPPRFDQKRWHAAEPLRALAERLETFEARRQFLQGLCSTPAGVRGADAFLGALSKRVSFAQMAQLVDNVLPAKDGNADTDAATVRTNLVIVTRDGTPAERWAWLNQSVPPDSVSTLVYEWHSADAAGTDAWVKSLPRGDFRAQAEQVIKNIWETGSSRVGR